MKNFSIKKIAPLLIALILASAFVELGLWQLHRAQDTQRMNATKVDLPAVPLLSIAAPNQNLSPQSINRIVKTSGRYVATYSAPNQEVIVADGKKVLQTLEVRLLNLGHKTGLLVVRGIESTNTQDFVDSIRVTGRLYPRQSDNRADPANGLLTRLDPSLIANAQGLSLIDGYIVATQESTEFGQSITADRVPAPPAKSTTPGFYWQHLSYVIIWWLMALLVLVLPFYGRLKDRISA